MTLAHRWTVNAYRHRPNVVHIQALLPDRIQNMSYKRFSLDSSAPSLWRVTFNHPPINLIDSVLIAELSELFIDVERNNGPP